MATGSGANRNAGLIGIPFAEDLIPESFQFLRSTNPSHSTPPFYPIYLGEIS
jgi:hypothetical protein